MKSAKLKLSKRHARIIRGAIFAGVAVVLASSSVVLALTVPQAPNILIGENGSFGIHAEFASLNRDVKGLEDQQKRTNMQVISPQELQQMVKQIQVNIDLGEFRQARVGMRLARTSISNWRTQAKEHATMAAAAPGPAAQSHTVPNGTYLPILMFHYTPGDFEAQLVHLERAGYTTIDLDQANAGLNGGTLPAKPVVITFDDGFANQVQAFTILKRHNMKATFYIINGGEKSRWCIGASRRYNDPMQPANGCGDAYLSWDQIRNFDQSGLMTIGGHTLDHENLPTLSAEEQRHEIADSKAGIEQQLGHPIKHFAYPYGAYNQTSIQVARAAGYVTAVTTLPGEYQTSSMSFTLRRVRDTFSLH